MSTLRPPYEVLTELVAALPASLASGDFRALVDQQAARLAALGAAVAAEQALGVLDLSPIRTLTPSRNRNPSTPTPTQSVAVASSPTSTPNFNPHPNPKP